MNDKKVSLIELCIISIMTIIVTAFLTIAIISMTRKDSDIADKEQTIGYITDQLLMKYKKYQYMNGLYLKGNVQDNYVWYNGFIWRIMGKNEDGSIRLITEENVTAIPWGKQGDLEGYADSYVKDWINNYFLPQLKDQSSIMQSKFCEDKEFVLENTNRTSCSNVVSTKGGLLSLDEYNLADETHSYLNNGTGSFTLNQFDKGNESYGVWLTYSNDFNGTAKVSDIIGIRVIVSVSPELIITSGNGTLTANQDTEYIVKEESKNNSKTLKDKAGIGEYVKFDERIYRIMEHTEKTTKLILDDYYDTEVTYGADFQDLNKLLESSELETWIAPTKKANILLSSWNRGSYFKENQSYRDSLSSKVNAYTGKVGLSRIGDILSTQSLSMLTNNYKDRISSSNTKSYWLLNPQSNDFSWYMGSTYYASFTEVNSSHTIRPIITISSNTTILSGTGVLSSPYEI